MVFKGFFILVVPVIGEARWNLGNFSEAAL